MEGTILRTPLPDTYAHENNQRFFRNRETHLQVDYGIQTKKKYGFIPEKRIATVVVDINNGEARISHSYDLPLAYKVGDEIRDIEKSLYELIERTGRTITQIHKLKVAKTETKTLEQEALEDPHVGNGLRVLRGSSNSEQNSLPKYFLNDFIVTLQSVTGITSLSVEGFTRYQTKYEEQLDAIVGSKNNTQTRYDPLLEEVASVIETLSSSIEERNVQEKILEYLVQADEQMDNKISAAKAEIIVKQYVPAYLKIKEINDFSGEYPDLIPHAFQSFFIGGFAGAITLSVIGEAVINGIFDSKLDIPGWYIGAGVAFAWGYGKAAYESFTKNKKYGDAKTSLLERINPLVSKSKTGSISDFVNEWNDMKRRELEKETQEKEKKRRQAEQKMERKAEVDKYTDQLLQLYQRHMSKHNDVTDLSAAVRDVKTALVKTPNIRVEDICEIIPLLGGVDHDAVLDFSEATEIIITTLGKQEVYTLETAIKTLTVIQEEKTAYKSVMDVAVAFKEVYTH